MKKFSPATLLITCCCLLILSGNTWAVDPFHARIDSLSRTSGKPDEPLDLQGSFGARKVPNRGFKQVYLFQGSERKGSMTVESWGESTITAKVPYGLTKGRYDLKICDGLNACSNSKNFVIRSPSTPELLVSDGMVIGFNKEHAQCGGQVSLTQEEVRYLPDGKVNLDVFYTYEEFNDVPASGFKNVLSWNEHNYAGRTPEVLREHANQQIGGHGKKIITTNVTVKRPEYGILILELNKDDQVKETNRISNRCTVALYFHGFNRDLVIEGIKLRTKKPTIKKDLTFDIKVTNVGKDPTPKSVTGVRIGGASNAITFSVPELEPKKSFIRRITVPKLTVAQKYRITAMADYEKRIKESNEGNNEKYISVTVKK